MKYMETARKAARAAGKIILRDFHRKVTVELKGKRDLVTKSDRECESVIKQLLLENHPETGYIGEETGSSNTDREYVWAVDPIDGTGNFSTHTPYSCVSIGLLRNGEPYVGVIYQPYLDELVTGYNGEAKINGKVVNVTDLDVLHQARIRINYPTNNEESMLLGLDLMKQFSTIARKVDSKGSVASDFYFVAAGFVDALVSVNSTPWDVAAGVAIARAAGAEITDFSGRELDGLVDKKIVVSNDRLHKEILKQLKP